MPVLQQFGGQAFSVFLDFAESVLPAVITGGAAMFDFFKMGFVGMQAVGEAVFSAIASIFATSGESMLGDGNWIDKMSILLSTVATTWPDIIKSAFLGIAVIINNVFSGIENKVLGSIENVQRGALVAAEKVGLITPDELEAGLGSIDEKQAAREEDGGFFDKFGDELQKSLDEVTKTIADEVKSNIDINAKAREKTSSFLDRIRNAFNGELEDKDKSAGGAGGGRINQDPAVSAAAKLISANEAGSKASVDLLNSRSLKKGADVNQGILKQNEAQTDLLGKILSKQGLSLPIAQGV